VPILFFLDKEQAMLHNDVYATAPRKILFAFLLLFLLFSVSAPAAVLNADPVGPYMVKHFGGKRGITPVNLNALKENLVFFLPEGKNGKPQVWSSNGTTSGTQRLASFTQVDGYANQYVAGNDLFFAADDGEHGVEPWHSNGTANGTNMIVDMTSGKKGTHVVFVGSGGKRAFFLTFPYYEVVFLHFATHKAVHGLGVLGAMPGGTSIKNTFFFAGTIPDSSELELWRAGGKANSTGIVKEINSSGGSYPNGFTSNGNSFWFFATDDTGLRGLWQSDGTTDGTQLIKELGDPSYTGISATANVQATCYFVIRNDTTHRFELWVSDSSEQGTKLIKDIGPVSDSSVNPELAAFGSTLVFRANDGTNGSQLWKSDGTPEGTGAITSFVTSASGVTGPPVVVNNLVFFSANDGTHGDELWQSDGTPEGASMVADINPNGNAFPQELTRVQDLLYFTAKDGSDGRELWAYRP